MPILIPPFGEDFLGPMIRRLVAFIIVQKNTVQLSSYDKGQEMSYQRPSQKGFTVFVYPLFWRSMYFKNGIGHDIP